MSGEAAIGHTGCERCKQLTFRASRARCRRVVISFGAPAQRSRAQYQRANGEHQDDPDVASHGAAGATLPCEVMHAINRVGQRQRIGDRVRFTIHLGTPRRDPTSCHRNVSVTSPYPIPALARGTTAYASAATPRNRSATGTPFTPASSIGPSEMLTPTAAAPAHVTAPATSASADTAPLAAAGARRTSVRG